MENAKYIEAFENSHNSFLKAGQLVEKNRRTWAKDKGPYQEGQKIKAPFELYTQWPHLYEKQVVVFSVTPEKVHGTFWVWRIKASEGKDIYSWLEPLEANV